MKWPMIFMLFLLASCTREPVAISKEEPVKIKYEPSSTPALTIQPRKFSKGEALYIRNCADCHGWEGSGNGPAIEYMDVPTPVLQHSELLAKQSESQFIDWVLYSLEPKLKSKENAGFLQTDFEVNLLIAHIRKLDTIDWDKVSTGQAIYDELCANCHGFYGHGDGVFSSNMPVPLPDLSSENFQNQHSDAELLQIISQGKNAMPGVENVLSIEEIKAVSAFVRLLSPGYESYDRLCASCHSSDGLPMQYFSATEDLQGIEFENIAIPDFDRAYIEAHTNQQLAPKVLHMLENNQITMLHFSEFLKPNEVRLIYQYLRNFIKQPS